jgi:hypothetical protein
MRGVQIRSLADAVGGIGAAPCAIHCLAGPLVLLVGSLLPSVLLPDASFHDAMLWLVVPSSTLAFSLGCQRHRDVRTVLLGGGGLLGLLLAATALHDVLGELGEKALTLSAAWALAAGHWRNFRLCRMDGCEHAPG